MTTLKLVPGTFPEPLKVGDRGLFNATGDEYEVVKVGRKWATVRPTDPESVDGVERVGIHNGWHERRAFMSQFQTHERMQAWADWAERVARLASAGVKVAWSMDDDNGRAHAVAALLKRWEAST